ncbi:hypothetical protein RM780_10040 [Streptomyces sp. DSM 44917]|uniref:Restriction endonuclease type IV Mrr domain-containing protein n=1 Tax=Streptomyces boetiae TaxID=3075541 RepID=A0ABU2L726_9ACTN|nr:hypothetical protein [Streptomyces sp. DSM 44917]MDT0307302.1 hypothetical protein [Streptomyces sp. DSM 44917]
MAIEWDHLDQPRFDRIVEALVHRMYDGNATVETVNGRGGDDGIDIKVTVGRRVRIFQLKYYPDGFPSSSFKGRQRSIKKSFERAMQHSPYEWILAVPCTLSRQEREFVNALSGGRSVRVRVMDRAELDSRLAFHSDLEAFFKRDQLFEAAKVYNQERAVLADGMQDLAQRVSALGGQVDNLDPHWTVDFARQGDRVVHTLRGKHPRAHEVSPVSITVTGRAGSDAELDETVTRAFGFGTYEEVVLPPEAVEALSITGPEWLAKTLRNVEVQLRPNGPAPHAGLAAELLLLGPDEKVTASYSGQVHSLGQGGLGRSVDVELPGGALRLLIPHDGAVPATIQFTASLKNIEPAAAARIFRLPQQLLASETFEVKVDGKTVSGGNIPDVPGDEMQRWEQMRLYVEDLAILQQHTMQYFPIPLDITAEDRVSLRVARLLIDGHTVASPRHRLLTCTLNGNDSPSLRSALTPQTPRGLRATVEQLTLTLAGRTFDLGPAHFSHPRAAAVNSRQALAALDTGNAEGLGVKFRPVDGEHFRLRLGTSLEDQPPTTLDLPGYPEPR